MTRFAISPQQCVPGLDVFWFMLWRLIGGWGKGGPVGLGAWPAGYVTWPLVRERPDEGVDGQRDFQPHWLSDLRSRVPDLDGTNDHASDRAHRVYGFAPGRRVNLLDECFWRDCSLAVVIGL